MAAAEKIALRPALPADAPVLAEIFRASVEELGIEDYSEAQVEAWSAVAEDEAAFAQKLAGALTLVALLRGNIVGFASLKGANVLDMLYVHPAFARKGVATQLCDALEKLAAARKAVILTADVSDSAQAFFAARNYQPLQRNMVFLGDEVSGKHHHDQETRSRIGKNTMSRERISLLDTTLRDGAQTTGVDFSLDDKKQIAGLLDALGIDYVEGGYPGANPLDTEFFKSRPTQKAHFAAFGMTKRAGRSAANDPGIAALLDSAADTIVYVAKAWDYQVRVALGCTLEENLEGISESVKAAVAEGREAMVDCEHFFDGFKENQDYALDCAEAAYKAGARWVVLCDTNGGTLPHEVEDIVRAVSARVPGANLGIHAHNDTEQAVANSFAALRGGARQIHGALNGLGRALRQRQSLLDHPDAFAQARAFAKIRDRRHAGEPARVDQTQPYPRRIAQSRARPPRPLCRRLGLRHQGRHPRLSRAQRPAHL